MLNNGYWWFYMIIYGHCIVIYGYMWLVMANHDNRYQQFKMVSSAYIKSDIVYIIVNG